MWLVSVPQENQSEGSKYTAEVKFVLQELKNSPSHRPRPFSVFNNELF
jgi:hypothetical protein